MKENKRGLFALSETAMWILALIALVVILFFIYFLRDKIMDLVDIILEFLER
ncbi:hypothetical protein J4443_03515 [Candidatus Woesearchaeota archaeon]|nr:hypothetical protein [Candidatus Woesearchaeota archaeon]